jgi:alkaline phosphatase D
LYSRTQEDECCEFLRRHEDKKILFLVLPVPVVHLPRWLAQGVSRLTPPGEDFSDRWSSGGHVRDRDRFLQLVHEHQRRCPTQRVILLSGDIHIGCAQVIRWSDGVPPLLQLVSSPIAHVTSLWERLACQWGIRLLRRIQVDPQLTASVQLLPGVGRANRNPYGGLNLGLVEIETPAAGADPEVRLLLYGHRGDTPVCVYRSDVITTGGPCEPTGKSH